MKVRTLATTAVLAAGLCALPAGAQAARGFTLGEDLSLNYLLTARRA